MRVASCQEECPEIEGKWYTLTSVAKYVGEDPWLIRTSIQLYADWSHEQTLAGGKKLHQRVFLEHGLIDDWVATVVDKGKGRRRHFAEDRSHMSAWAEGWSHSEAHTEAWSDGGDAQAWADTEAWSEGGDVAWAEAQGGDGYQVDGDRAWAETEAWSEGGDEAWAAYLGARSEAHTKAWSNGGDGQAAWSEGGDLAWAEAEAGEVKTDGGEVKTEVDDGYPAEVKTEVDDCVEVKTDGGEVKTEVDDCVQPKPKRQKVHLRAAQYNLGFKRRY